MPPSQSLEWASLCMAVGAHSSIPGGPATAVVTIANEQAKRDFTSPPVIAGSVPQFLVRVILGHNVFCWKPFGRAQ